VLKRRVAALVITVRAQNPTGARISETRAGVLRAVLKRHPDLLLIENDPFGPVSGARAVTLTGAGRSHWAIVRSLTKFLDPDLRVAIVAGDELTVARVRARQSVGMRWVSHLLQHMALALWSDPSNGRHLARAGDTYARRRQGLIAALAATGTELTAASGFNVWIPVRHEGDVVEQLARRGWAVAGGERFRLAAGPGIRVTTSALAPDDARRFATDFAHALGTAAPPLA
jgi:DNA-binding transcriptional MocR family regulator